MKAMITIMLMVGVVWVAAAYDLGNQAPVKPVVTYPENVPNPERQGGDTIADAFVIPGLPFNDTGTTAGYNNDYDQICPYSGSTSPDVIYSFVPGEDLLVDVDLCGSAYDTKTYILDASLAVVACNDDFYYDATCGMYVSKLEDVPVSAGLSYYIIIDGYGGGFGNYILEITGTPDVPCAVDCIGNLYPGPEGEPPLVDGYVDNYNGGCNTPGYPFQELLAWPWGGFVVCGVSGWYVHSSTNYRDTDWFILPMSSSGPLEVTVDAEYATYIFELGPQDCENVAVIQSAIAGPCQEVTMTITGYEPWSHVWFWVGPTVFVDPDGGDNMYDYVCWIDGFWHIATDATTWSTVKALFE